ncbi:MAG: hybrid sensor histidine kinase/response regulator [Chloroflexota bacterium]
MSDKPSVLYIEDDKNSRVLVTRVLRQKFEVTTAQNGLEGLDFLKRQTPDIVLTDLNLPDLNGDVIAARIRTMTDNKVPIVAITANTDMAFKHRAMAAGCVGYLTKPINVETLADTITEFLDGHTEKITDLDRNRATQEIQADLTQMVEKTLRQVQEDNTSLRNLERAKTAFLQQVSHELRTPLTVLSGYIQMLDQSLQKEQEVTASHRDLAKHAVESTKRLHILMNEIVVMARLTADQLDVAKSPLRFDLVAQEAISEYEKAFEQRKLTFEKTGEGWSSVLLADSMLLRMAFSNLLSNAIKATPDGGKIIMSVNRVKSVLEIKLIDTGVGVEPEHMALLFKPFFTAIDVSRGKTSKTQFMGMGMGMGLTIVTKVIQAHGGRLWAESPGYDEQTFPGSTFYVLLPLPNQQPVSST